MSQSPATFNDALIRDDIGDVTNAVIALESITAHPRNYNTHPDDQLARLEASDARFGQVRSIVVQAGAPGHYLLVAGHGYTESRRRRGKQYIKADIIPATWTDEQVTGYLIADNMTAQLSVPDDVILAELIQQQQNAGYDLASLGTSDTEFAAFLDQLAQDALAPPNEADIERPKKLQPNSRHLPIDVIYTVNGTGGLCCLGTAAGLKYGIQSNGSRGVLCPYSYKKKHKVTFIDNAYDNYDHEYHRAIVMEHRPKYATVRDIMTKQQCAEAGIEYYPLDQILAWAEDIAQYTENVIIIPKYDCLDEIPEHYVLGYSVPTSHGGTPLAPEAFKGRRVHLLDGSWSAQLSYMAVLGDDVVSLDNNYVQKMAMFGQFVDMQGVPHGIDELGPMVGNLTNPMYVALTLSLGAMAAKVNELYSTPPTNQEDDDTEEIDIRGRA